MRSWPIQGSLVRWVTLLPDPHSLRVNSPLVIRGIFCVVICLLEPVEVITTFVTVNVVDSVKLI